MCMAEATDAKSKERINRIMKKGIREMISLSLTIYLGLFSSS